MWLRSHSAPQFTRLFLSNGKVEASGTFDPALATVPRLAASLVVALRSRAIDDFRENLSDGQAESISLNAIQLEFINSDLVRLKRNMCDTAQSSGIDASTRMAHSRGRESRARPGSASQTLPLLIGGRSGEVGMSRRASDVTCSLLSLHLFILGSRV